MISLRKLRLRQDGDTIVEVLIALAVLTLVLAGAYYTANQSYRNDRDSQEHTEALTVAQSQLEALKFLGYGGMPAGDSCIDNNTGTPAPVANAGMTPTTPANCQFDSNNPSVYDPNCTKAGVPYCYFVIISNIPANDILAGTGSMKATLATYEIQVSWNALGGKTDYITLYYRVDSQ